MKLQKIDKVLVDKSNIEAVEEPVFSEYLVRVKINNLNIRMGAGLNYNVVRIIEPGEYTIVEETMVDGATWGKLKSGAGWINLYYTERV